MGSPILSGDLVVCQAWRPDNYANMFPFRYFSIICFISYCGE